MKTTISIHFEFRPYQDDPDSSNQLGYGDREFKHRRDNFLRQLNDSASSVITVVSWTNAQHFEPAKVMQTYSQDLEILAKKIDEILPTKIATLLSEESPCGPSRFLMEAAPGLFDATSNAECKYSVESTGASRCRVVDERTHICDGVVYAQCPFATAPSVYIWKAQSNHINCRYTVRVRYIFKLVQN